MIETKEKFEFIDDLELHYIKLKKFKEYNNIESIDLLSKWIIFTKNLLTSGMDIASICKKYWIG